MNKKKRYIIHNKGRFMLWSPLIRAPVSWPMSLEELKAEYPEECTDSKIRKAIERGTSADQYNSMEETVEMNAAGAGRPDNFENIPSEQIWRLYERERKKEEEWDKLPFEVRYPPKKEKSKRKSRSKKAKV